MPPPGLRRPMIFDTFVFEQQSHKKPHFRMSVFVKSLFLEICRNLVSGGSRGDAFRSKKQKKSKKTLRNSEIDQQSYENHCFWESWGSSGALFAPKKGFDLMSISRRRVIKNHGFWKKTGVAKKGLRNAILKDVSSKTYDFGVSGCAPLPPQGPKRTSFLEVFFAHGSTKTIDFDQKHGFSMNHCKKIKFGAFFGRPSPQSKNNDFQ